MKQKDSIDHAMELASTVVENFGLNDAVSPCTFSFSLVNTGQFDFDSFDEAYHNATTTSTSTTEAEQSMFSQLQRMTKRSHKKVLHTFRSNRATQIKKELPFNISTRQTKR